MRWGRTKLPFPPGPRGYPIIGNLLDMPSELQWEKYSEWSKKYGSDIIYLNVLGNSIVVLNSYKAVNDLLSVRSSLYSDRPVSTMLNELLGWGRMMSFMPYGEKWRTHRRAFWQEFNPKNAPDHQPTQLRYSRDLLRRLLKEPQRFLHHIDHTLSASIIALVYGLDVKPEHDPNVERAEKALVQLQEASISGSFMVDLLPFLKYIPSWMPGGGFKAYAERVRPDTIAMREMPYEEGCGLLREGKGNSCVISRSLARGGYSIDSHPDRELIKNVAWIAYAGGAETSRSVVSTFVAAMLLYPEVQRKGQNELDSYLGSRLPVFEDLPHLPYVHAIMLEALRWQSVGPLGVAHRLTMDDEYKGYFIPKGSTVFVNVWALLRDEECHPDPDTFNPERFLKDGKLNPKTLDSNPNFGSGRRICPGRFFAMDSILISVASTLFCFDITKAKDAGGRDIEPDIRYAPASSRQVLPFECSIKPRSAQAATLIRNSELV
ncbi:hypothetical protein PLEOSDRAFT_1063469 [Pleurotus ostreatus PC15]|uniref:Cytochrome P450 n=1 Tax=Pleurotus ostreatus (strain PC15) TaxID=1137138 RepID=A0A067NKN1_PLEO1|nr:hypothetical protein PLEOSDRAFT_1063469 [Pleurotus ostreatus PC15]